MKNNRVLYKILFKLMLFLFPFGLILISFLTIDPFMVIKTYNHYNGAMAQLNGGVVSTEMYLKNRAVNHYDSFIFGNSRTLAYKTHTWKAYLNPGARPFVYFSFNESLEGLLAKLKFIDAHNDRIKNALFIIDEALLCATKKNTAHHSVEYPIPSGATKFQFYLKFYRAYLSDFFFIKCIDYSLFHKKRTYMAGAFDAEKLYFDPITNDLYHLEKITSRKSDSTAFYQKFRSNYTPVLSSGKTYEKCIYRPQEEILLEIKHILNKHVTDYTIIISPKLERLEIHPEDKKLLKKIFGATNVYDFSGTNNYSSDIHNFLDPYHYTKETGARILKEIYTCKQERLNH